MFVLSQVHLRQFLFRETPVLIYSCYTVPCVRLPSFGVLLSEQLRFPLVVLSRDRDEREEPSQTRNLVLETPTQDLRILREIKKCNRDVTYTYSRCRPFYVESRFYQVTERIRVLTFFIGLEQSHFRKNRPISKIGLHYCLGPDPASLPPRPESIFYIRDSIGHEFYLLEYYAI